MQAADRFWQNGEPAIANFRLLFAGVPSIADPTLVSRMQLADDCLSKGIRPSVLLKELGLDPIPCVLGKYDPEQPRAPAGSRRSSGEWIEATLSFLADATPEAVSALARFATRFSTPTAVLGALFIPTPNSGGVTRGTLPGAPDISFERDDPAGRLLLSKTAADGSTGEVRAQLRAGLYIDVFSGTPLGRNLNGQLYLDLGSVQQALSVRPQGSQDDLDEKSKAAKDEPKLCPAPTPDIPHGANPPSIAYEQQVHDRVNPLVPLTQGLAVKVLDLTTGKEVNFDDCFRYQGDLIDRDMNVGDLADAKGPTYAFLLEQSWSTTMAKLADRATVQLRVATARGVRLKWYFAEKDAADKVRNYFSTSDLRKIVIGYMAPR